jgi:hypothetical protein
MKKLLTALALSAAVAATAYTQRPKTDAERDGLKGHVKSVSVETAELEKQGGRSVEGRRVLTERTTYNAAGDSVESEGYENDGTLIGKAAYRRVGGEVIVEEQVRVPTISIDPALKKENPNAEPIKGGPVPGDYPMQKFVEKLKDKYDAKGNLTEHVIEENGRVKQRAVYEYKDGSREGRWYEGGNLIEHEIEKFDARGNLVETDSLDIQTGAVGVKFSYTAYEFDSHGNWVKRIKTWSAPGEPEYPTVEYRTITYF